jgi:hypothetical protein
MVDSGTMELNTGEKLYRHLCEDTPTGKFIHHTNRNRIHYRDILRNSTGGAAADHYSIAIQKDAH